MIDPQPYLCSLIEFVECHMGTSRSRIRRTLFFYAIKDISDWKILFRRGLESHFWCFESDVLLKREKDFAGEYILEVTSRATGAL